MGIDIPSDEPAVRRVLARYRESDMLLSVEALRSAGGFSGAELWRVTSSRGLFCLRRWPSEHPSESRLQYIHRVLRGVFDRGVVEVAAPVSDTAAQTIVAEKGALWELTPWMPGAADYHRSPSPTKLAAAMRLLARFHIAAADLSPKSNSSPVGVSTRCEQLRRLMAGEFAELRLALRAAGRLEALQERFQKNHSLRPTGQPLTVLIAGEIDLYAQQFQEYFPVVAPRLLELLERAKQNRIPLQPCIRDVWHDHVLFTNEQVTGLIDFGALRDDHIASDIARLLGSLVRDDQAGWSAGIFAYEQLRPLSPLDRQLITVYDQSGVLLSAMNWLQWLYVDGRRFDDLSRVHGRCAEIATRLSHLAGKRTGK